MVDKLYFILNHTEFQQQQGSGMWYKVIINEVARPFFFRDLLQQRFSWINLDNWRMPLSLWVLIFFVETDLKVQPFSHYGTVFFKQLFLRDGMDPATFYGCIIKRHLEETKCCLHLLRPLIFSVFSVRPKKGCKRWRNNGTTRNICFSPFVLI